MFIKAEKQIKRKKILIKVDVLILERLYTSNLMYKYIFIKPTQMRRNSSSSSITKNPNNYIREGNLKLTKVLELLCKTPMSGQTLQNVFNKHAFILVLVKDIERKKPFLFSRMILIASCNLVSGEKVLEMNS